LLFRTVLIRVHLHACYTVTTGAKKR